MKQLKLIGFVIFLFFLTESLNLPTKPQDVDFSTTQKFIEENVGHITTIAFAQYIQEASFEEAEMLAKAMTEYKDQCLANSTLSQCLKLPQDVLLETICAMEGLPQKHNFSHCCSKVNDERRRCFFRNKKGDVGFLPPLPTLDPEVKCQAYKNNSESFLSNYIYEVSRRNPFVFTPTLLRVTDLIEEMTKTCCEEQDKANCFRIKAEAVVRYLKGLSSYQKNVCGAYVKFGQQVLNSIYIVILSNKFPRIEFKELISLLQDVSSKYDVCCEGDAVQCVRGRSKVMSHICSKQDSISNNIKKCCEKKIPERGECIINSNKDDRPNDLSLKESKFTENEHLCEERKADQDIFMANYLIKFTKMAPQLSTDEVTFLGEEMVTALTTCCTLSEEFACVDNLVDLVVGEICGVNENRTINPAVDHCCNANFAFRRPCFEALGADKTYVPPSTSKGLFTFHADLCQAHNEELQRKKDRFLVNLVKLKPELTDEALLSLLTDFTNLVDKCCKVEGPQACFNEQVPELVAKSQVS
ncbi:afamin isoform X2 [Phyllostomus hastatus]|uniref:afamin isoform X2 n=1 Tax=Phyllostomus hastatus TaxID=9423 RepID=UPI001E67F9AF|nr:afamin isoform X2 [Phyllostomus hastatus]